MIRLKINGTSRQYEGDPDMPLLWFLRDNLELTGTKYGCGMGLCGSCTVHVDGKAVRTVREQRTAQLQQVEALRSALSLANLRYKGGLANYLDVLIAQRNLFEAELALMGTHRLHLVSIVQLYKALGGGWTPEGQPSVSPVSPALEKS